MFSTFLVSQLQLRTRSMENQEELLNRTRCRSHCERPPEALPDQVWHEDVWVYRLLRALVAYYHTQVLRRATKYFVSEP